MRMRGKLGRALASAAMLLAGSACALGSGAPGGIPRPVQLQVTNHSGGPMEVYATAAGVSYRVGTVHPGLTGRFALRPGVAAGGSVEFTARSADGHLVQSGPMLLRPGDVVDFALTPRTATTTSTVRAWVPGT
jgi:hypothetical protein